MCVHKKQTTEAMHGVPVSVRILACKQKLTPALLSKKGTKLKKQKVRKTNKGQKIKLRKYTETKSTPKGEGKITMF